MFKKSRKISINYDSQLSSYIGKDTRVEGTVITKASLRVDGTIIGGVLSDGNVVVSESGQVKGNIIAKNIIVAGRVDGNMQISDEARLESTATANGDITSAVFVRAEEADFRGKSIISPDNPS